MSWHAKLQGFLPRRGGRRAPGATRGIAAPEFAVVGSMLVLVLVGITDLAVPMWQQMQVGNAARAGAINAALHGFNTTANALAATNATSLPVTVNTPTSTCGCPNASTGITVATCGSSCTGAGAASSYVTVTTSYTYTPLLSYLGLGSAITMTGTSIARVN